VTLRVLHVIADGQYGGAQWYLIELAREQRQRGHAVTILSGGAGPLAGQYGDVADRFLRTPSLHRSLSVGDLTAARELAAEAAGHDIVHVHASKALFVSQLPPNRLRVVWSAHGYDSAHAGLRPAVQPIVGWAKAVLARRCGAISAASLTVASKIERAGVPRERIKVIYTGVRAERFGAVPDVSAHDPMVFGAAGRFVGFKGFNVLVDAAARLAAGHVHARFVLYGSGPDEAALRQRIRTHGIDHIFEVRAATPDLPSALVGIDVIVVPSLVDSFPLVPCEAMVAGRPVVVTRVGGLPEALVEGEHGLIVRPGDAEELANTLTSLVEAPARVEAMGQAARTYARARYRWERVADEYDDLYDMVKR
jgi:glycosyltransferase involved in cell wall biosynthesis